MFGFVDINEYPIPMSKMSFNASSFRHQEYNHQFNHKLSKADW